MAQLVIKNIVFSGMTSMRTYNTLDEQKQKRLEELEQIEAGLFEDNARGLLDEEMLNFELEGISVSRSILTELKKPARRRKTQAVAW